MHYHLPQHTGKGLLAVARFVQGVHNLSNSTSPPDHVALTQGLTVAASAPFDRMEADIKALQQQALATQASIQQLNARPSVDPWTAIQSKVPAIPVVDSTSIGVSLALAAALAAIWWYLWQRPQTLHIQEASESREVADPHDAVGVLHEPQSGMPLASTYAAPLATSKASAMVSENPQALQTPTPASLFSRSEMPMGFDSEAAAGEVTRVRKSLAEKREARALLRERDEPPSLAPSLSIATTLVDEPQSPELSDPDAFISMTEVAQQQEQTTVPDQVAEQTVEPDYGIILDLAQESVTLEMWPEARELATEVLESADPALLEQALELLKRIEAKEQEIAQDSQMLDIEL